LLDFSILRGVGASYFVTEEGAGRVLEASRFCRRGGSAEEDTARSKVNPACSNMKGLDDSVAVEERGEGTSHVRR
jgi:hypothetical protein